jgi:hypothetical protein
MSWEPEAADQMDCQLLLLLQKVQRYLFCCCCRWPAVAIQLLLLPPVRLACRSLPC